MAVLSLSVAGVEDDILVLGTPVRVAEEYERVVDSIVSGEPVIEVERSGGSGSVTWFAVPRERIRIVSVHLRADELTGGAGGPVARALDTVADEGGEE